MNKRWFAKNIGLAELLYFIEKFWKKFWKNIWEMGLKNFWKRGTGVKIKMGEKKSEF